jgi:hypothetical protein
LILLWTIKYFYIFSMWLRPHTNKLLVWGDCFLQWSTRHYYTAEWYPFSIFFILLIFWIILLYILDYKNKPDKLMFCWLVVHIYIYIIYLTEIVYMLQFILNATNWLNFIKSMTIIILKMYKNTIIVLLKFKTKRKILWLHNFKV